MSDSETPAAEAAPAGGRPKPILLIAGVVLGLALGGATGALVVGPKLASGMSPAGAAAHGRAARPASDEDAEAADDGDEGEDEEEEPAAEEKKGGEHGAAEGEGSVHVIDNLVLNPANSNGTRFLLLTVAFDMKTSGLAEQLKSRDAEVRDAVLGVVGAKSVEQLATSAARDSLKSELRTVVAKLVKKKNGVRRIYFPQFVIQ